MLTFYVVESRSIKIKNAMGLSYAINKKRFREKVEFSYYYDFFWFVDLQKILVLKQKPESSLNERFRSSTL